MPHKVVIDKAPQKTKQEVLKLAKERIEEIDRSRLPQEEKKMQILPYLKIVLATEGSPNHEATEKLYRRFGFSTGLGPGT